MNYIINKKKYSKNQNYRNRGSKQIQETYKLQTI